MIDIFTSMIPPEKSKIHHMIKYLSLNFHDFEEKLEMNKKVKHFGRNLTFKCFEGISLAGGWLITSYTNAIGYLTYDHYFILYGMKG